MSDVQARPLKQIKMQVLAEPVRRTTGKGDPVAALRGKEIGDTARGDKETKVALFDDPATQFLREFESRAADAGETPQSYQPVVQFDGYWAKNEWTKRGTSEVITSWEFRAKAFSFS